MARPRSGVRPGYREASSIAANVSETIGAVQFVEYVTHWQFLSLSLPTVSYSSVLFHVTDYEPTYYWCSSETSSGPGASGDVPTAIPLPGTALLLGAGLAGLGLRRKAKA